MIEVLCLLYVLAVLACLVLAGLLALIRSWRTDDTPENAAAFEDAFRPAGEAPWRNT